MGYGLRCSGRSKAFSKSLTAVSLSFLAAGAVLGFSACGWGQQREPSLSDPGAGANSKVMRSIEKTPMPADLAIVLDAANSDLVVPLESFMRLADFNTVVEAFEDSQHDNPLKEDSFDDWQLVSLRVVPCKELSTALRADTATICWPQLRMVFQPIFRNYRGIGSVELPSFGADRAIHMLFDVKSTTLSESAALQLLSETRLALKGSPLAPLPLQFKEKLLAAQQPAVVTFISDAIGLRDSDFSDSDYATIQERPESDAAFAQRVVGFVKKHAFSVPQEVTAFSLPPGSNAAEGGEWKFVQFDTTAQGRLIPKKQIVYSAVTGEQVADLGMEELSSLGGLDAPVLEELVSQLSSSSLDYMRQNTLIFSSGTDAVRARIEDPRVIGTSNTTCASCHRLNKTTPFNFHNLSYLENFGLEVSIRVVRDVEADLRWLSNF